MSITGDRQTGDAPVLPEVCLAAFPRKELSFVSYFVVLRSLRLWPLVSAALALLLNASPALAQTQNPNVVAFHPSAEHSSKLASGQPAVSRYDLVFYREGTTEPIVTVDLGKPAPQADGVIRVDYTSRLGTWPLPGVQAVARVTAVGPGGVGTSAPSNAFVYICAPSLSTTSGSVAASGGTGMVEVVAGALCGWSAKSAVSWITITSGASGAGTGWVNYSVAANTTSSSRTGTLTIAGLTYTVTQAAGSSQSNVPPVIKITKPSSGSSAKAGNPIKIVAEASDADGISKVEFYVNGQLIATATSPTYRATWMVASQGRHTLTAVAVDRLGARTTSDPVVVTGR